MDQNEARFFRAVAMVVGGCIVGTSVSLGFSMARAEILFREHHFKLVESSEAVQASVEAVNAATVEVQDAITRMSEETGRVQKLAIWVGVGAALVGSILGAVGGALLGG